MNNDIMLAYNHTDEFALYWDWVKDSVDHNNMRLHHTWFTRSKYPWLSIDDVSINMKYCVGVNEQNDGYYLIHFQKDGKNCKISTNKPQSIEIIKDFIAKKELLDE